MDSMNKLSRAKRTQIIAALVEGSSIRSTCRMTGAAKGTVLKLLADVGQVCADYHDENVRGLTAERIQCDEIWAFVYAKAKNVPKDYKHIFGVGDVWTWVGIDADTKLVASWMVGGRDAHSARLFMEDLSRRLAHRVQLTTDGHAPYLKAVEDAFDDVGIDYATLVKLYGSDSEQEKRYSPAKCVGTDSNVITGKPDPKHVSTSYIERQNLSMRMGMRRFTRLTNAFSKKLANLEAALAIYYLHYNFVRVHQTLGTTPAVAAGVALHEWTIEEIVGLLEAREILQVSN